MIPKLPSTILFSTLLTACGGAQPKNAAEMTDALPPLAKKIDKVLTNHGQDRHDPYYWMRSDDRSDPAVLAHLQGENAYKKAVMAPTEALQKRLFEELKGRVKKDDSSVPTQQRSYWYYTRFEDGKEYPIYCRRKGSMDAPEQVILDVNALAAGKAYFAVASLAISEDEQRLAYTEDDVSRRLYTLKIKDLTTGETLADAVPETSGSVVWAADDNTLFYVRRHPTTLRAHQVFRHTVGAPNDTDVMVHDETDETFYVDIERSKSRRFVVIELDSTLVSETRVIEASAPLSEFRSVLARSPAHEYQVWHKGDDFYVRTNWEATNFRLMRAPIATSGDRSTWVEVIPHRADVWLGGVELFDDYYAVEERKDGLQGVRVIRWADGESHDVQFDDAVYVAAIGGGNPEFTTDKLRFVFSSLTTPDSVFEYDMGQRSRTLLKQDEILGGFDAANYRTERVWVAAHDGAKVPLSLVFHKDHKKDGQAPFYLYAYGSYGYSMEPDFVASWLSLLDRGFGVGICHTRGGQEMGRAWYEDGKLLKKNNTFTDFVDCTRYLIDHKFTQPDRMFAGGGSAGGLLIGAVANLAPQLYRALHAAVPFVDVVTTMLDDSIPLTTGEYDEWGNPNEAESFKYMLSYSPYDNVTAQPYPSMIVTTGLHDSQVQYWEPAKWVARLRELKTDDNLLVFDVDMEAGHGGASGRFKRFETTALVYSFFLFVLDPSLERWTD